MYIEQDPETRGVRTLLQAAYHRFRGYPKVCSCVLYPNSNTSVCAVRSPRIWGCIRSSNSSSTRQIFLNRSCTAIATIAAWRKSFGMIRERSVSRVKCYRAYKQRMVRAAILLVAKPEWERNDFRPTTKVFGQKLAEDGSISASGKAVGGFESAFCLIQRYKRTRVSL